MSKINYEKYMDTGAYAARLGQQQAHYDFMVETKAKILEIENNQKEILAAIKEQNELLKTLAGVSPEKLGKIKPAPQIDSI